MDIEILKIASKTDNIKVIDNYTHHSKYKNKFCGDLIEIHLIVNNDKILDFAYQTKSCIFCQASASLLAKAAKNKSIKNIETFHKLLITSFQNDKLKLPVQWMIFKKLARKKYYARKECIELPFKALSKAIKDYND